MTDLQSSRAHCFESDPALNEWLEATLSEQPGGSKRDSSPLDGGAQREQPFDLARMWSELCAGRWRFVETFTSRDRHYAILEESRARPQRRRNQSILERIFSGISRKEVAIDLDLAQSTVSVTIQLCLSAMGLTCRASSAPVILAMAVRASISAEPLAIPARVSELEAGGRRLRIISAERPERRFPVDLSRAELAVGRLLAVGYSHAEIATLRQASVRTVANQLAGVFRKLGVSGRAELVDRLISHASGAPLVDARPPGAGPRAVQPSGPSKVRVAGRRSPGRRRRGGRDLPNPVAASSARSKQSAASSGRSAPMRKAKPPTAWPAPAAAR